MRKTGILYLLMLLIPTLLLGVGGVSLLMREQAALAQRQRASHQRAADLLAERVHLLLQEILVAQRAELASTLSAATSQADLQDRLQAWERRSPYVRNTFIWDPERHLLYPDARRPATDDQAAFLQRYTPLFSGLEPWPLDAPQAERSTSKRQPRLSHGWLPWYAQNRLHLLGWHLAPDRRTIVGVELEMAMILGRFITFSTELAKRSDTVILLDGNGQPLFQTAGLGDQPLTSSTLPRSAVTAEPGPYLPHWRLALIPSATSSESGFLLISSLLLGILLIGSAMGGTLLWLQSRQSRLDARRKSDFVSNVSHELKTPLTSIRMYAEMLQEGRAKPEKRQRYLDIIATEAQRLTRLVNNVLDFSRMEQNRKEYDRRPLDLDALVRELVESHAPRLQQAGLAPQLELQLSPRHVLADRDATEQILLNLLDNAIKYAPDGGELRLHSTITSELAELCVEDRGPGVPADHQTRIFQAFHRVDSALSSPHAGTGLGLSICHRLATDQGGSLTYRNRSGGGAVFCLRLPLAEPSESPS